jgi:hypothetical protein
MKWKIIPLINSFVFLTYVALWIDESSTNSIIKIFDSATRPREQYQDMLGMMQK